MHQVGYHYIDSLRSIKHTFHNTFTEWMCNPKESYHYKAQVGFPNIFQVKCTPMAQRRSGFHSKAVHVSFVLERVTLGQDFFEFCRFAICT